MNDRPIPMPGDDGGGLCDDAAVALGDGVNEALERVYPHRVRWALVIQASDGKIQTISNTDREHAATMHMDAFIAATGISDATVGAMGEAVSKDPACEAIVISPTSIQPMPEKTQ